MNEFKKNLFTFERFLDNEKIGSYIYLSLLLTAIIIYGFFGAFPLYKVIVKKAATVKELTEVNTRLHQKNEGLKIVSNQLTESQAYIKGATMMIPNDPAIEDFLMGMVEKASKAGFSQERFFVEEVGAGYIKISATYNGPSVFSKRVYCIHRRSHQTY